MPRVPATTSFCVLATASIACQLWPVGSVGAQILPDLALVSVSAPANAQVGDSINVSVVTKNVGSRDVSINTFVRLFLAAGQTPSPTDSIFTLSLGGKLIRAGQRDSFVVRMAVPNRMQRGNYYVAARVDPGNAISEANETNNLGVSPTSIQLVSRWDLTTTPLVVPDSITSGSTLNLSIAVKNLGAATVPGDWVGRVYLSQDGTFSSDDIYLGDFTFAQRLAPGATLVVPLSYALNKNGNYRVMVIVDGNNALGEETEGNNIVPSATVMHVWHPYVDLVGILSSTPPSAGSELSKSETIPVTVKVRNTGSVATNRSFAVKLFLSSDANVWGMLENPQDLLLVEYVENRLIPAKGEIDRLVSITMPLALEHKDFFLGLKVDPTNSVPEAPPADGLSDFPNYRGGGNNEHAVPIKITALPDLQLVSATSQAPVRAGSGGSLTFVYTNAGQGAAASGWKAGFCVQGPSNWAPADSRYIMPSCSATASPLEFTVANRTEAGSTSSTTMNFAIPSGKFPGRYSIVWSIDKGQALAETVESNNAGTMLNALTVMSVYDLEPKAITWDTTVQTSAPVNLKISFTNSGEETVPAGWSIAVYLSPTPGDRATWRGTGGGPVVNEATYRAPVRTFVEWAVAGVLPGDFAIVVLDPSARIPETVEANNTLVSALPIRPPSP